MKDTKIKVSEAELQAAIRKFLNAGGMIRKLPEQKALGSRMVGRKWLSSELEGELT